MQYITNKTFKASINTYFKKKKSLLQLKIKKMVEL